MVELYPFRVIATLPTLHYPISIGILSYYNWSSFMYQLRNGMETKKKKNTAQLKRMLQYSRDAINAVNQLLRTVIVIVSL